MERSPFGSRLSDHLPSFRAPRKSSPSRPLSAQIAEPSHSARSYSFQGSATTPRCNKTKLLRYFEQARRDAFLPYQSRPVPPIDRARIAQQLLSKFAVNFPTYKAILDEIQADYAAVLQSLQRDVSKSQPLHRELALIQRSQSAEIGSLKDSLQDGMKLAEASQADAQQTIRHQRVMIDDLRAQVQRLQEELSEEAGKARRERTARMLMAERLANGMTPDELNTEDANSKEEQQAILAGLQLKNQQLEKRMQAIIEDYQADVTTRMSAKGAQERIEQLTQSLEEAVAAAQAARQKAKHAEATTLELKEQAEAHTMLIATLRQSCAKAEQEVRALNKGRLPIEEAVVETSDFSWFQGELPTACQPAQAEWSAIEWDDADLNACLAELQQAFQASQEQLLKVFYSTYCHCIARSMSVSERDVACSLLAAWHRCKRIEAQKLLSILQQHDYVA
eukprot:m.23983 g.23983  ORF g.23983 m.23983 type:complete len:450 (+) comp11458_c0_seq1:139-1488(+)